MLKAKRSAAFEDGLALPLLIRCVQSTNFDFVKDDRMLQLLTAEDLPYIPMLVHHT